MNESLRYLGTGTAAPVRAHPAFAATRAEPDMGETVISPHRVAAAGPARGLRGRHAECVALDRLVAEVRAGQSRVLILRGESGAGKTALLEHLLDGVAGFRIARAAGAESEMELAFAGLHQLCAPFLDQVEALPGPQREALEVAFGLRDGDRPDRFRAGPAVEGGREPTAGLRGGRRAVAGPGLVAGACVRGAPSGGRAGRAGPGD